MILGLLGMSRRTCLFIWIWSKSERLQQWRDSLFRSQKTLFSSPRAENSLFSALELENRLFSPLGQENRLIWSLNNEFIHSALKYKYSIYAENGMSSPWSIVQDHCCVQDNLAFTGLYRVKMSKFWKISFFILVVPPIFKAVGRHCESSFKIFYFI